ncbi:MAG: periplasmic divalent cation tolerance protein [Patescibacteria group bacterium]|nr:periplasmic divalent cation tolerance protein [Patescibacteria group bacterium]
MTGFCQLWLTCANSAEADKVSQALLDLKLAACAKQVSVDSSFLWKGQKDNNHETLLVMDSREDLFEKVEREVAKLHSYETFVLQAIPVSKLSKDAQTWLEQELA